MTGLAVPACSFTRYLAVCLGNTRGHMRFEGHPIVSRISDDNEVSGLSGAAIFGKHLCSQHRWCSWKWNAENGQTWKHGLPLVGNTCDEYGTRGVGGLLILLFDCWWTPVARLEYLSAWFACGLDNDRELLGQQHVSKLRLPAHRSRPM